MSILREEIKSLFSKLSVISFKSLTQLISVATLLHFSLYSKCAATHISAYSIISPVLI
jgi:hypothetical protein